MSDIEGKVTRVGARAPAASEVQIVEDLEAALQQFAEIAIASILLSSSHVIYHFVVVRPFLENGLKLVRCPRSLAPTLVALPSMSLIPSAPLKLVRCPR